MATIDFEPESIPEKKDNGERNTIRMCCFGKTQCGKSHAIKALLSKIHKRFDEVYLFSPTSELQPDTYSWIPDENKIKTLDIGFLNELIDTQEKTKIDILNGNKQKTLNHILLFFDDMISNTQLRYNKTISKLYVAGRHFGISCIVTSQCVGGQISIAPEIRTNCDYIMSFGLHSEVDRKLLIERHGSITNKKDGTDHFKNITEEKYVCCIFDLTNSSVKTVQEYVFRYMAPEKIKKFYIGDRKKFPSLVRKPGAIQNYPIQGQKQVDIQVGNINTERKRHQKVKLSN